MNYENYLIRRFFFKMNYPPQVLLQIFVATHFGDMF